MPGDGGAMAKLEKPARIAANRFMSEKWDEITSGRTFEAAQVPLLSTLCHWYAVQESCMDDMDVDGELRVAYMNDVGDLKAMPQINTLKQSSAEIRALNKQLGINDEAHTDTKPKETKLYAIQGNRKSRAARSRAAGS